MLDSLVAMLAYQATRYFATGAAPRREGNLHATIAPYGTFATADGSLNVCVATTFSSSGSAPRSTPRA